MCEGVTMASGALVLKVRDREFKRQLRRSTAIGLRRAGAYLHTKCRQEVSKPNTGTRHKRTRDTSARGGGKVGSQYTTYDNPSKPGEPPHLRTGFGRSGIVWEYNDNERDPAVRVGATKAAIYMIYLELGTRFVAARPWLVATLMKYRQIIGMLAVTGGKREA